MNLSNPYIRYFFLYSLRSRLEGAESDCHINSEFGEDTFSEHTAQDRFARFRPEEHDVKDGLWSDRSSVSDDERLLQLAEENAQQTTCQASKALV